MTTQLQLVVVVVVVVVVVKSISNFKTQEVTIGILFSPPYFPSLPLLLLFCYFSSFFCSSPFYSSYCTAIIS